MPRKTGVLRIAHISDLHLTQKHQKPQLHNLISSLAHAEPDIVVATGDVADSPRYLPKARSILERVCEEVGVSSESSLYVAPGNHDEWTSGVGFGGRQGFDTEFSKYFRRLPHRLHEVGHLRVGIVCLDSNPPRSGPFAYPLQILGALATFHFWEALDVAANALGWGRGRLTALELAQMEDQLKVMRTAAAANPFLAVVALHHHPVAVATGGPSPAIEQVSLALENAAQALASFQHNGVDLVLHGHQHVAFIADGPRILPGDPSMGRFGIVSSGPSFSPRSEVTKPSQWSQIDISDTGAVKVTPMECREAVFHPQTDSILVRSCEETNRHLAKRRREGAPFIATKKRRHFSINSYGDAEITTTITVVHVDKPGQALKIPITGYGGTVPAPAGTVRLVNAKTDKSNVAVDRTGVVESESKLEGHLTVMGVHDSDLPLQITYSVQLHNGYGLSKSDLKAMFTDRRNADRCTASLAFPVDELELCVTLEDEECIDMVTCKATAAKDDSESPDETARVKEKLWWLPEKAVACWRVVTPNPDARYMIELYPRHEVRNKNQFAEHSDEQNIEVGRTLQQRLVKIVKRTTDGSRRGRASNPKKWKEFINQEMSQALDSIRKSLGDENDVEVVLFGFDDVSQTTLEIARVGKKSPPDRPEVRLAWGQGVVGRCFRSGQVIVADMQTSKKDPRFRVFYKLKGCDSPHVILGVPFEYPLKGCRSIPAVLSIASFRPDTMLYGAARWFLRTRGVRKKGILCAADKDDGTRNASSREEVPFEGTTEAHHCLAEKAIAEGLLSTASNLWKRILENVPQL